MRQAIIERTIFRHERVQGWMQGSRVFSWDDPVEPGSKLAAALKFLHFVNGDPCIPRLQHFCTGCCRNRQEAVDSVVSVVIEMGLLGVFDVPSVNRWGTCSSVMAVVTAGVLLHGVLPRSVQATFARWKGGNALDSDETDFRNILRAKVPRAKMFLGSASENIRCAVTTWVSEPADYLWHRLQRLDEEGCALLDVLHPSSSPFVYCLRAIVELLAEPFGAGQLAVIYERYGHEAQFVKLVRQITMSMAGQLHWRFIFGYQGSQYALARLVDVRYPDVLAEARRFVETPDCCLDAAFARKVKQACGGDAARLCEDSALLSLLRMWVTKVRVSNMHLERDLSAGKRACPAKAPLVERLCCSAFLQQLLRRHAAAGGLDPRSSRSRHQLVRKGVPLKAKGPRRPGCANCRDKPVRKRSGFFRWANAQIAAGKSRAERCAKLRELAADFRQLSPGRKRALAELERSAALKRRCAEVAEHREDPQERYARLVGGDLFGLSDIENPVRPECIADGIFMHQGHGFTGINVAEPALRKTLTSLFVPDAGAAMLNGKSRRARFVLNHVSGLSGVRCFLKQRIANRVSATSSSRSRLCVGLCSCLPVEQVQSGCPCVFLVLPVPILVDARHFWARSEPVSFRDNAFCMVAVVIPSLRRGGPPNRSRD